MAERLSHFKWAHRANWMSNDATAKPRQVEDWTPTRLLRLAVLRMDRFSRILPEAASDFRIPQRLVWYRCRLPLVLARFNHMASLSLTAVWITSVRPGATTSACTKSVLGKDALCPLPTFATALPTCRHELTTSRCRLQGPGGRDGRQAAIEAELDLPRKTPADGRLDRVRRPSRSQ